MQGLNVRTRSLPSSAAAGSAQQARRRGGAVNSCGLRGAPAILPSSFESDPPLEARRRAATTGAAQLLYKQRGTSWCSRRLQGRVRSTEGRRLPPPRPAAQLGQAVPRVRCSQARPAPGMTRGTMALAALLALLLAGELARPRRRRQPPPASAVAVHCSWTSPCCLCTCCMPVETSPRLLWADVVRFHGNVGWRATCRHRCRRR